GGANQIVYTITATDALIIGAQVALRLSTAEGASLNIPVNVTITPLVPTLVANPGFLAGGMLRGNQTFVSFDVSNIGGASSGNLEVNLPESPWLSLVSVSPISPLGPGEHTTVTLALKPTADLALARYDGSIVLGGL